MNKETREVLVIELSGELLFSFDLSQKTSGRIEVHKKMEDGDYLSITIVKGLWEGALELLPQKVILGDG